MTNAKDIDIAWDRVGGQPQGAPTLWRTAIPDGWLVCLEGAAAGPLTFVRDPEHAWGATSTSTGGAPAEPALPPRSDRVVASPGIGIATTEAELAAFDVLKEMSGESRLAYTDTQTYFAVHLGNPMKWLVRIVFAASESWVGFCIDDDEGAALAQEHNIQLLDANFLAKVRVAIAHPDDLRPLLPLLQAALRQAR